MSAPATLAGTVVRRGTLVWDRRVVCDIRIVRSPVQWGTGDFADPPEIREDIARTVYYVEYGSTVERGRYVASAGPFESVEDAERGARNAVGTVTWLEDG